MTAEEYLFGWLDKKYGGSPTIEDWTSEEVMEFAEDYHKSQLKPQEGDELLQALKTITNKQKQ